MTWNNRIFRHKYTDNLGVEHEGFGIHETYYDEDGKPTGWTKDPISGLYDSVDELIKSTEMMLNDSKKYQDDILEYTE